eukprot:s2751_g3.t1
MASPRQDEVNLPVMRARWEHDAEEDVAAPGRSRSTLDLTRAAAHYIARQELTDPSIQRTTPAMQVLWGCGRALRDGAYSSDLYKYSKTSTEIPQFWFHSWHGHTFSKVMLITPRGVSWISCRRTGQLGRARLVFFSPWVVSGGTQSFIAMAVGLLVAGPTLIFWRSSKRVFLDKILFNVALAQHSASFLVCWDTTYSQRLFCILEMAAFEKATEATQSCRSGQCFGDPQQLLCLSLLQLGPHPAHRRGDA